MNTQHNYNAIFISRWDSGAEFFSPCTVDHLSHRVYDIFVAGHPSDDDSCYQEVVQIDDKNHNIMYVDDVMTMNTLEDAIEQMQRLKEQNGFWRSDKYVRLSDALYDLQLDYIRQKLIAEGKDSVETFLGYDLDCDATQEHMADLIDEVAQQMPEEEFDAVYQALTENRPFCRLEQDVRELKNYDTQNIVGPYTDADTILADILEDVETEVSGTAAELMDIYLKTKDKKAFSQIFEALTGVKFSDFIHQVKAEMKTWHVPVSWTMTGYISVQADTAQNAFKKGQEVARHVSLPVNGEYLEDSFRVDEDQEVVQVSGEEV